MMKCHQILISTLFLFTISAAPFTLADTLTIQGKPQIFVNKNIKVNQNDFGICYEWRDCNISTAGRGQSAPSTQLKICYAGKARGSLGCSWRKKGDKYCTVAEFNPNPQRCKVGKVDKKLKGKVFIE